MPSILYTHFSQWLEAIFQWFRRTLERTLPFLPFFWSSTDIKRVVRVHDETRGQCAKHSLRPRYHQVFLCYVGPPVNFCSIPSRSSWSYCNDLPYSPYFLTGASSLMSNAVMLEILRPSLNIVWTAVEEHVIASVVLLLNAFLPCG